MILYSIHAPDGSLRADRIVFPEDAAAFVSVLGDGATVRVDGSVWKRGFKREVVWTEGVDGAAAESYDEAGDFIRLHAEQVRRRVRS